MLSIIYGIIVFPYLLIKNRETVYIISDKGIGDIYPTCAYIPAFKMRHNVKHVSLIGIRGKDELYNMYPQTFDKLLLYSKRHFEYLSLFTSTDIGYMFACISKRIVSTRVGSNARGKYIHRLHGITYLDAIKYGTYNLSEEDKMVAPRVEETNINYIIEKYDIEKGRTVILNPYANSIDDVPAAFFELIVSEFVKKGYKVITNLSLPNQVPISGTYGIRCSLSEAYQLANYCSYAIGTRSGFFDLIAYANCKIMLLFPQDYGYVDFQRLSKWGISNSVYEVKVKEYDKNEAEKIVSLFLAV